MHSLANIKRNTQSPSQVDHIKYTQPTPHHTLHHTTHHTTPHILHHTTHHTPHTKPYTTPHTTHHTLHHTTHHTLHTTPHQQTELPSHIEEGLSGQTIPPPPDSTPGCRAQLNAVTGCDGGLQDITRKQAEPATPHLAGAPVHLVCRIHASMAMFIEYSLKLALDQSRGCTRMETSTHWY